MGADISTQFSLNHLLSPPDLNVLLKLNPIVLLLPVLLPVTPKDEFSPCLVIPNSRVLLMFPFSFFKKGFSAPTLIDVLPLPMLRSTRGTLTCSSS